MYRSSFIITFLLAGFLVTSLKAQSIVDPGISVHNYKHPNKAAQAKASGKGGKSVQVAGMNTVENFYKRQNRGSYTITTPKYAVRPATLVVIRRYEKEGVNINPHLSPRNYKAQNNFEIKKNTDVADYYQSPDSTAYPVID